MKMRNNSNNNNSNNNNKNMVARALPVDPNLPRWACQNCRQSLSITGVDDKSFIDSSLMHSGGGAGSVLGGSKMDHSFVVLSKQHRNQSSSSSSAGGGLPPRPRNSDNSIQSGGKAAGFGMEESFVVLPPSTQSNNSGFHSAITVLKRAFEIATTQTKVEQPLCLECMTVLSDKLDKEVEDVNRDITAYDACLKRLTGEPRNVLTEAEFFREKLKIEEEERKLEAEIKATEKQCNEVTGELKELELKSNRFKELEERYWHEFNNFQFQLISHQEERDAILAKIDVSQAHLELLKRINVLSDAFPISNDGEFGTINNFRLGRLPKIPVEWDEINAAWGQACLLLHTMARNLRPKFPYKIKILPMGSYPRIMDSSNNTYELFGPVNLFWSTRYDKAMTLFLTSLQEFAEFANSKDKENNVPPEKCFKFPYKIENDKVYKIENDKVKYSITQSFNKPETWTKALKYTLCNLKWALHWFISNTDFQPLSVTVDPSHSAAAVPAAAASGSLYRKRVPQPKQQPLPRTINEKKFVHR